MSHSVEPREKSKLGIFILLALVAVVLFGAVNLLENRNAQGLYAGDEDQVLVLGIKEIPFSDQYKVWARLYDREGKVIWQQDYKEKFSFQGVVGLYAEWDDQLWSIHLADRRWILGRKGKIDQDIAGSGIALEEDSPEEPREEPPSATVSEPPMVQRDMGYLELEDGRTFYVNQDSDPLTLVLEVDGEIQDDWNLMKNFHYLGQNPRDVTLVNADKGRIAIVLTMEAEKMDYQEDRSRWFRFSMIMNRDGSWNEDSYQLIQDQVPLPSSTSSGDDSKESGSSTESSDSYYFMDFHYGELSCSTGSREYTFYEGRLTAWDGEYVLWEKQVFLPLYRMMEKIF